MVVQEKHSLIHGPFFHLQFIEIFFFILISSTQLRYFKNATWLVNSSD